MASIGSLKKENAALTQENRELKAPEHQDRFRTIFDYSRLANKVIASDFKILQVNMALVRLLGYDTKEDIIGTRILDYSPPDFHDQWKMLQKQLWKKAVPFFSLETCLVKKDGSSIWCQVTSILFPDKAGPLGYTIIEDVTEQHQLKLHKEQFISVASHELKTPITSLKANLQMMSRMLKNETKVTEQLTKMTNNAEKHVTKLSYLVGDLLSSTKIEQGQLSLKKTKFVLEGLVDECCSHIRLEGKYHINYLGDPAFTLFADRDKIDQVMVNLVNNAVKYAPESLEIGVGAEHKDGLTKVWVSDKGEGIAAENIGNLFDRYFRLAKDNNHTSGLGLGLYISAEIIRLHGGDMGVESKLGKGTTVWFTIPDEPVAIKPAG
ncbi:MAG: PAS domain-containing sensor histidine kinase [Bacteroidota bacterium]|nr:PAS domain-containing sensor histidine kinase [Bacteroidota bacterium]